MLGSALARGPPRPQFDVRAANLGKHYQLDFQGIEKVVASHERSSFTRDRASGASSKPDVERHIFLPL